MNLEEPSYLLKSLNIPQETSEQWVNELSEKYQLSPERKELLREKLVEKLAFQEDESHITNFLQFAQLDHVLENLARPDHSDHSPR